MHYILSILLAIGTLFAQSMTWWVVDNGGGMQTFSSGDTAYASIGQTAIGETNSGSVYLGAGYLYIENTSLSIKNPQKLPKDMVPLSVSPNPFNSSCKIEFSLPKETETTVKLFDVQGRIIDSKNFKSLKPGKYTIRWDAGHLPSGVYFIRLNAGSQSITRRVALVK